LGPLADEAGSFSGFFPDIFAPIPDDAMTSCDDPIAIGYDRSSRVYASFRRWPVVTLRDRIVNLHYFAVAAGWF
jgi:hypothetical protein